MSPDVMKIILGTRGSQLALAQADLVKQALNRLPEKPEVVVEVIKTTGDQRMDIRLSEPGPLIDKGLFTKELEEALLLGKIDIAVHSLKDLPTALPPGLELGGVLGRHDSVDLLISRSARTLNDLPFSAIVATSSLRRAKQLVYRRPDILIADVRGNVTTRIEKLLRNDSWNSIVLAKAGLERLGFRLEQGLMEFESQPLFVSDLVEILPAVGQGAIGLENAVHNALIKSVIDQINEPQTWFCVAAERELLKMLGGGCQTPLGVRTRLQGKNLHFEAILFEKGGKPLTGAVSGPFSTPSSAATALLEKIYAKRR
jgi:hydroxymethylbilane synthase